MSRKNRGFPLEYYPVEILTEREAVINRKMFLFRVTGMGGALTPNDSYVKAFQQRWKRFAEHKDVRECGIQTIMGEQCYVVKHDLTRIF